MPKRKGIAFLVVIVPTVIGLAVGLPVSLVFQATWARVLIVVGCTGVGAYVGAQSLIWALMIGAKYEKEH
ncbi:hypothetical protein A3E39_03210 [Candidatus Uhrbacteria bacterium RIFCSPHIGHO2_12_FULL_60_25]|uniref:Uncharacterized protein n=1 Tax=Candidatus Uhrbacteria bacterium RIFCSPHIGHO2_12_FULL_60_25 TaxID=1802399 RepID=A0A1F7UNC8_9BACT|nr:MAG: hypothetical protein A3D73_00710 [Candidatus Uhrbacteria bacterium RIFCSPHIGHO2_02_FULL_60_44]OGL79793.1 MAG: hypothetical protein A3E39_03210 [Candidatus Uhrbacteria bacterium RIFCSPHIGHO2_12_FULL_60_25]